MAKSREGRRGSGEDEDEEDRKGETIFSTKREKWRGLRDRNRWEAAQIEPHGNLLEK